MCVLKNKSLNWHDMILVPSSSQNQSDSLKSRLCCSEKLGGSKRCRRCNIYSFRGGRGTLTSSQIKKSYTGRDWKCPPWLESNDGAPEKPSKACRCWCVLKPLVQKEPLKEQTKGKWLTLQRSSWVALLPPTARSLSTLSSRRSAIKFRAGGGEARGGGWIRRRRRRSVFLSAGEMGGAAVGENQTEPN